MIVGSPIDQVDTGTRQAVWRGSLLALVILLTGWGQRLMADGEVPAHVDRVLSKPPKLRELRTALAEAVRYASTTTDDDSTREKS